MTREYDMKSAGQAMGQQAALGANVPQHVEEIQREMSRLFATLEMLEASVSKLAEKCERGGLTASVAIAESNAQTKDIGTATPLGSSIRAVTEHTRSITQVVERLLYCLGV